MVRSLTVSDLERLEHMIGGGAGFVRPMRRIPPYTWGRCRVCGGTFEAASYYRRYCAPACANAARAARRRDEREVLKAGRLCVRCALRLPAGARADTRYCSPACRQAAYRERYASRPDTNGTQSQSRNT